MGRFVSNPSFESEMEAAPTFQAGMHRITRGVERHVEQMSPRQTGYYVRHVESEGHFVGSTDPFGHLVEWGSRNNPPYAPLRRGVRAAGLRLDESQH